MTPGQGGKGQSQPQQPQGKAQASGSAPASPQGKGALQGAPGASTGTPQGQAPNVLQLFGQMLAGGAGQGVSNAPAAPVGGSSPISGGGSMGPVTAQAQRPGFPTFNPATQGYHGASSAQQNPNQGGASSNPSSITSPSTSQGGMT